MNFAVYLIKIFHNTLDIVVSYCIQQFERKTTVLFIEYVKICALCMLFLWEHRHSEQSKYLTLV